MTSVSEAQGPSVLDITAEASSAGELRVAIRNATPAPIDHPALVEIKLPVEWVDERVGAAARAARTAAAPPNMAALDGVVTVGAGWSGWAYNDPNDHVAAIRMFNNLDRQNGKTTATVMPLAGGATLDLRVPLRTRTGLAAVTVPYSYQIGGKKAPRVDGSIDVTPAAVGNWAPRVSLTTDQPNPMTLRFAQTVKISWQVADAVGAVLRGPLSGGHSELTLSRARDAIFWIEDGSIEIRAVGAVTYLLDAEVKGPPGMPNVQVVRAISLDISKAENYGSIRLQPFRVLPYDQVEIQWAVWGVRTATLLFGQHRQLELELTEQDLSRNYQGVGIWSVRVAGDHDVEKVSLVLDDEGGTLPPIDRDLRVASWDLLPPAVCTGTIVSLAHNEKHLALLTSDGVWLAFVGGDDTNLTDPTFRRVTTASAKQWLALTAFDTGFVVLRQLANEDLQLVRIAADGGIVGVPVDLPPALGTLVSAGGRAQLVAFDHRAYVVVQGTAAASQSARSVGFAPLTVRSEPLLEHLPVYELVAFGGGLYTLSRATGGMLRFDLAPDGRLDDPRVAAGGIYRGASMIDAGLPVSLGQVLVVLGPRSVPRFDDARPLNLLGATARAAPTTTAARAEAEPSQDLVYNPQKDQWTTCGHGLTVPRGAVAAFRGGASKRLWVLEQNRTMHTLQGAGEGLFAPDYVSGFPSKPLPLLLDTTRRFVVHNDTGWELQAVDDVCRAAQLDTLSSVGPALLKSVPTVLPISGTGEVEILFSSTNTSSITLRFLARRAGVPRVVADPPGRVLGPGSYVSGRAPTPRYLLELQIFALDQWDDGPVITRTMVVHTDWVRVAEDRHGKLSIARVPDARELVPPPDWVLPSAHARDRELDIPMAWLGDGVVLARPPVLWLYIPLAKPGGDIGPAEIWALDVESLTVVDNREVNFNGSSGWVRYPPSALVGAGDRLFLGVGTNRRVHALTSAFKWVTSPDYSNYDWLVAVAASESNMVALVAATGGFSYRAPSYALVVTSAEYFQGPGGSQVTVPLDGLDVSLGPADNLAVSPDGATAAISVAGGVFLHAAGAKPTSAGVRGFVPIANAREGAGAVVTREWVYCANVERIIVTKDQRKSVVAGRHLTVSKLSLADPSKQTTITLPDVSEGFALTTGVSTNSRNLWKDDTAFSLALSPDGRALFVSAGKTVHRIDTGAFRLESGRTLDLPCRVFAVTDAPRETWRVFAIGAWYAGGGPGGNDFMTKLYSLHSPKG